MINLSVLLGFIGPGQIWIILAVVILLFGAKKIPELMKGVGQGMKEFKDAQKGDSNTPEKTEQK